MIDFCNLEKYRENNRIEAKKALGGLPKSIWETYSAFANTHGGIILLGVEEWADKSLHTVDLPDPDRLIKEFWDIVNNPNKTSVNVLSSKDVFVQEVDGDHIVVINVPRAERSYKPVYVDGNPLCTYRRNGEGDYRCTKEEYQAMVRDASVKTQDMLILNEMDMPVFNKESIRSYRQRMRLSRPSHVWEALEDEDFLLKLGAVGIGSDGKKHPTSAGLLMFGNEYDIVREFNAYFLDYQEQYDADTRWTDRIISSSGDWSGNVYDFYFRVYNKLIQDIKVPFKMDGGTRIDDKDALAAMLPWLQDEYGNASQPYSFARKPKKALTDARATIAACIGAEPEEIYFTSGGTESDNWAIKGLIEPNDKHQTITSQIEHHAVLNACNALERLGYPVVYLPVDSQGVVLSDSLSKAITEKTKLVSVMMVNNEIGTIEPIKELATIAHTHNVLFHTDAVQAVGHIPIDVNELGIDMLSSSAHKFNGPKGIGFLYIRKGTQIRPLADGGAQEFHMRAGTENIASIVGMAVALKKNCRTMQETSTKLQAMDHAFIDVLHEANVDFIRNGSVSKSPGIISVSIRNISGEMLLHRLDLKGISISTGSACDSVNTQVSHVIKAIGVPSAYAQGTIRISFGHDNQIEDAVEIAHAIAKILQT